MQKSTLVDVAKKAGVCTMTVSRVLNQHAGVKMSTIAKVKQAIAALDYRQNEAARLMKGQRARLIGYIVPDLSDQFFAACAHKVQQLATAAGYMTLVASSNGNPELEREQVKLMADRMPSGILLVTARTDNTYLEPLLEEGLLVGALNRPLRGVGADLVVSENHEGAFWATEHLISHGHTRIACLGQDFSSYGVQERVRAYRDAMRQSGLTALENLDCTDAAAVEQWLSRQMAGGKGPTAVFTANHRCTLYLYQAVQSIGLSMPQDLALVGFDDFAAAALLTPPLTAVAQSVEDLAHRSFNLLLSRIQQKTPDQPRAVRVSIPVSFQIRASCGCTRT